ncbi:DNA/RNA non-specific endonuclease, partial [Odoribacter splanchnicus]|nr:DNA/RNA non-specific endonuclease [Odoribacter splanchnicus]
MTGKKRYSRRWTRLIGGLLGLGIVWGFYVSRTSDKEIGAASLHEAKRLFEYTELLPSGEGEIVRHTYYTLSFNSRHKQANWVYYTLELEGKERVAERTDRFREDKKVP